VTHGAGRRPGDVVVLREVWRGRVWTARPATLVADEPEAGLRFFVPRGSVAMMPFTTDGRPLHAFVDAGDRWDLRPTAWRETNVLSFAKRGRPHAVLAFWDASWAFVGWYVNLQTPLEPTAIGFDYLDQELDAWVDPDAGTWSWKDEDELERSVAAGIWTDADAERIRREGAAIAADVVERRRPFDRDWPAWRPDPDWPVPELPPGWDAGRPVPRAPRR
jgi:predicted RNA-binding protein associated with RNAse of E/G family